MIVEFNIGLNVKGRRNSIADVQERAERAVRELKLRWPEASIRRYDSEYEGPDGIEIEPGLAVKLDLPAGNSQALRNFLWVLAMNLEQDCIAVLVPEGISGPKGCLIGPYADRWGQFEIEWFKRFDEVPA